MTSAQTTQSRTAIGCLLAGVATALYVEITGASVEDPIRSTFSEYIYTDQGARLVGVAMVLVGLAALSVSSALVPPQARWLTGTFGIGLMLLAVFPQEPADMPLTWHGAIHRYVALTAFIALPAAALRLNDRTLRFLAIGSLATLVIFVATFVPATGARAYSGLAERVLLAIDLVILLVMAKRPAWQPRTRESGSR